MNADLVRLGIAAVVGAHGVGHVLGWMPAWGIARFEGVSSRSWLLTDLVGDGGSRVLAGALWLAPTVGFVVAAAGLLGDESWWRPLAAGSAVLSLLAVALFWEALPLGSRIGCVAVDLIVLAGLVSAWSGASSTGS